MIINRISNTNFYSIPLNFPIKKGKQTRIDRNLSHITPFLGQKIQSKTIYTKDDHSFTEFNKARLKAKIFTLEDLEKNIKDENLLGEGMNSKVYYFDDPNLDNWVLKVDKKTFKKQTNDLFLISRDNFIGQNFGQEVATAGERYRILKKVTGTIHSIDDWSDRVDKSCTVTKKEAQSFLCSIKEIAEFPEKSYFVYAEALKKLSEKGYKQDSINPNNILIDYENQKINVIDFFVADDPAHVNTSYDLSSVLLDFTLFESFYEKLSKNEQKELVRYSKAIIKKCRKAAKMAGICTDENTYLKYLENVDKWFGAPLVNKGGNFKARYLNMKNILNNLN